MDNKLAVFSNIFLLRFGISFLGGHNEGTIVVVNIKNKIVSFIDNNTVVGDSKIIYVHVYQ